jgi:hypothetical protein
VNRRPQTDEDQTCRGALVGITLAVFIVGVLAPLFFGTVRTLQIGFHNMAAAERIERVGDLALWLTALALTVSTTALIVLTIMQARLHRAPVAGVAMSAIAAIATSLNWYVIVS